MLTDAGTANEDALNEIRMSVVPQSLCRRRWPGYIMDTHMCVGMGSAGACRVSD